MARMQSPPRPVARVTALAALPATIVALLRRLRTDWPVIGAVAGVTLVTSALFAAIPPAFNRMSDDGLRSAIASAKSFNKNVQMTRAGAIRAGDAGVQQAVDAASASFQGELPPALRATINRREFVADTVRMRVQEMPGQPVFSIPRFITMRYQSGVDQQVRLVDGRLPARTSDTLPAPESAQQPAVPIIEVALSPETARQIGVAVGDELLLLPDSEDALVKSTPSSLLRYLAIRVTGLVELQNLDGDYWFGDPRLDRAVEYDDGTVVRLYAYALYSPDAYNDVIDASAPLPLNYTFRYFIDPRRVDAGNLDTIATDVRKLDALYPSLAFTRPGDVSVRTGLSAIFRRFGAQRDLSESILALASIGLLAVALTVIGLVAGLSAERRRDSIALVRSRGASTAQVLLGQAAESLTLALPAALGGWLAAVTLVGGRGSRWALPLALGIALATTALAVVAMLPLARRNPRQRDRPDASARAASLSPRRVAAEACVALLAVAGIYLLRRRGLSASSSVGQGGGFDPYLAAVPVLVGLAVGIVVLRIFPLPVRILAWLAALRRDLVPSLGFRRVARQPSVTALPLLVLLLAVAVAVFSSAMLRSIERGQVRTSWETVGAAYRVDAFPGTTLYSAIDLRGVAGVEAIAEALEASNMVIVSRTPTLGRFNLLAIDAPSYAAVTSGTPVDAKFPDALLRAPAGVDLGSPNNPIPVIVSRRWVADPAVGPGATFAFKVQDRELTFIVSQVRDVWLTLPRDQAFVVAPLASIRAAMGRRTVRANTLYLRAPASSRGELASTLAAQSGSTTLVSRAAEYNAIHDAPLISGVASGFRVAMGMSAAYSMLTVVVALALTASARARDLAFLRTLGLSERQSIGLAAFELTPPVVVALVSGIGLGVLIARLIEPGINLTAFTGPGVPTPIVIDWLAIGLLSLGLIVLVALAVWSVGAVARRANLGSALRLGDE